VNQVGVIREPLNPACIGQWAACLGHVDDVGHEVAPDLLRVDEMRDAEAPAPKALSRHVPVFPGCGANVRS
jgi:hypothetical protein